MRGSIATLGLLLWAAPAAAQEAPPSSTAAQEAPPPSTAAPEASPAPDAGQAALAAATVLDNHCADVAGGTMTASAQAMEAVGPVLTQVSEAHDATGAVFLLYWRGRLNSCLDREERAQEDLESFVAATAADPTYADQRAKADQLLRRIERSQSGKPYIRTPGLAVAGGALAGGAGVLGGLSAWQWGVARQKNADFADGGESWTDAQLVRADGLDAVEAQRVLLGSAIATGAAGVATFVLSWVEPPAGGFAAAPTVVPTEGGVAVGFAGRF